jgi:DNA-directed RNA polymerase subunit M/transcription elongation factor TFIIS
MEKKVNRVCKCEKCGNEAEMVVTCSLPDSETEAAAESATPDPQQPNTKTPHTHKVRGTAHCTHCGNEADMWIDL